MQQNADGNFLISVMLDESDEAEWHLMLLWHLNV